MMKRKGTIKSPNSGSETSQPQRGKGKKKKVSPTGRGGIPKIQTWHLPNTPLEIIDPLFRHRVQSSFQTILSGDGIENSEEMKDYAVRLERTLAINCNFEADLYEDMTTLLIHALEKNITLTQTYDPSVIVSLDEEHLFPDGIIGKYQRNREVRRLCFESLLKKLTSDVAPDGHPLLQCRKCQSQADFSLYFFSFFLKKIFFY